MTGDEREELNRLLAENRRLRELLAEMGAEHLALVARQLGMQPRFLVQQARDMADRVPAAIEKATREIAPSLTPSARPLAEQLERFATSTTKKLGSSPDRVTALLRRPGHSLDRFFAPLTTR